ncbi:MAG: hypothetical protein ACHP6H_04255, partial [Legionellales bacterium]
SIDSLVWSMIGGSVMLMEKIASSRIVKSILYMIYDKEKGNLSRNIFYCKSFIDKTVLHKMITEVNAILNKTNRSEVKDYRKGGAISY